MVNPATSDYSDATTVSGVLTDSVTNAPIAGEPVTLQLNGNETCTATTDATGTASCTITPGEPAATYTLTGTFAGDSTQPLAADAIDGSANFVVTLEETRAHLHRRATVAQNGQPLTVSGVLTTDDPHSAPGSPAGRSPSRSARAPPHRPAPAPPTASGSAACTIASRRPVAGADPGHRQLRAATATTGSPARPRRQPARRDPVDRHPGLGHLQRVDDRSQARWSTRTPTSRCRTSPSP